MLLSRLLSNPAVIDRLRKYRSLYSRIFERRPTYSAADAPAAILSQLNGKAVFLLSFGRSGTTVFCDFLATHPDVISLGEVLNEDAFRSYFKTLRRKAHGWRPSITAQEFYAFVRKQVRKHPGRTLIFDMKFESLHLIEGNWRIPGLDFKLFDALIASGTPVILLDRRDKVARYVSHETAAHRNVYHSFQQTAEDTGCFSIDIEDMRRNIDQVTAQIAFVRKKFAGHSAFVGLEYESLFTHGLDGKPAAIFDPDVAVRLASLLGLADQFDLKPRLEAVSGGKGPDLLANRSEVETFRAAMKAST